MRHCFALALVVSAACGGKTSAPPPPNNEVATDDTGDTGGDSYGGWDYGGYGGDYYGGYGYGGSNYGGYDQPYVPPPPAPPNLVGTWKSACVAHEKAFRRHEHVYTDARFDVRVGEFSDAACTKRTSEVHHGGTYAFGVQTLPDVNGWEANFTVDVREITADDKKSAKAIAKACGVKKLKAKGTADIREKGCPKLAIAACTTEYDVAAIDGDRVRLGTGDACAVEQRPTTLDASVDIHYQWQTIGIADCDAMIAVLPRYMKCMTTQPSMQTSAGAVFDALRQMETQLRTYNSQTSRPEAVKAVSDGCKQGTDGLNQALAAMGC